MKTNIDINYNKLDSAKQSLNGNSPQRTKPRPTSPHLQIYKWEWTMLYSILHRACSAGCLVLSLITSLIIILMHTVPEFNYTLMLLIVSPVGLVFLFLSLLAMFYFIFAEIKYMIWSKTFGLELCSAKLLGNISVFFTIIATVGVMICYI